MIEKKVLVGAEAREAVLEGARFISEAVRSTLGPFGANGLIEKGVKITNDGVSIAKEIQLEDEAQDLALRKIREACTRTNDKAGDGTTTAMTLSYEILDAASRAIGTGGFVNKKSTAEVIRQIEREKTEVIEKLTESATPITSEEQLVKSAIVSVEDDFIGEIIGKAQWELGADGILLAEESNDLTTSVERVYGVKIDNGLGATQVINNQEKQSLDVSDCPVVLTSHTVESITPFQHIGKALGDQGVRNLVIIARAFSENAIRDCIANGQQGFNVYPVNAPYTDQREVMKDLEATLGGRYLDHEETRLKDIQLSDLGSLKSLSAKRYEAIITGQSTEEAKERVAKRVEDLEATLAGSPSDFEKKQLQSRIAQLTNGFAIVKVGAVSETERKRLYDKVEDAVHAVRAALQEGTVKGGGLAYKEIAENLPDSYILKRPLQVIHEQVIKNAPPDFIVEEWVRDPLKVLRVALEQACSVAGDLATTEIIVVNKREKKEKE